MVFNKSGSVLNFYFLRLFYYFYKKKEKILCVYCVVRIFCFEIVLVIFWVFYYLNIFLGLIYFYCKLFFLNEIYFFCIISYKEEWYKLFCLYYWDFFFYINEYDVFKCVNMN